ncbi:uncharacterized protein [Manis javanica]|uniref:uncharacterized protein isoform X2 n=1 Tax=Manis javanica TaxID=9974 RepID=UPI003C6D3A94
MRWGDPLQRLLHPGLPPACYRAGHRGAPILRARRLRPLLFIFPSAEAGAPRPSPPRPSLPSAGPKPGNAGVDPRRRSESQHVHRARSSRSAGWARPRRPVAAERPARQTPRLAPHPAPLAPLSASPPGPSELSDWPRGQKFLWRRLGADVTGRIVPFRDPGGSAHAAGCRLEAGGGRSGRAAARWRKGALSIQCHG